MSRVRIFISTFFIAILSFGMGWHAFADFPPNPNIEPKYSFWIEGDSIKAKYFNGLAEEHLENRRIDSAIYYSNKALEEYESTYPTCVTIKSYLTAARGHIEINELGSALRFYMKSVKMLEIMEPTNPNRLQFLISVYSEMGNLYKTWGLPKSALEYFLKIKSLMPLDSVKEAHIANLQTITELYLDMELYEKAIFNDQNLLELYYELDKKDDISTILKRISENYVKKEDHDGALEYSFRYLAINRELDDKQGIADALNDIGFIYKDLDDYHKSLNYFLQYLIQIQPLEKEGKVLKDYKETLLTIGLIYEHLGDIGIPTSYTHALNYYDKKLRLDIVLVDKKEMARTCNLIADIYLKKSDERKAEEYSQMGLTYGKMSNSLESISESYLNLYEAFSMLKKEKKALYYFKLHDAIEDSLHEKDIEWRKNLVRKEIAENRMQYITNKREQMIIDEELSRLTIAQLELESERQSQELHLLKVDNQLREAELENEQLAKEKALQALELIQQQIESERQERIISLLEKNEKIRELTIKQQQIEKEEKQREVELLEKEKKYQELQLSKQETLTRYSIGIIVLVSIILVLILFYYLNARKANKKLAKQKEQILTQAVKIERSYKDLELLSQIGQEITSSLSVEKVTHVIYQNINHLMDATTFAVGLFHPQNEALNFTLLQGDRQTKNFHVPIADHSHLASFCYQNKKEIIFKDYEKEIANYGSHNYKGFESEEGQKPASLIMIPLMVKRKVIGVLSVQSFEKDAYNDYDLYLLRNIAIYANIALENATAYMHLAIKSENLKAANKSIIAQKETIEQKNGELLALSQEKSHLVGIVAHDLRNPLSMAISLTKFLSGQTKNLDKTLKDGLNVMQRSLSRMDSMINKILDIKAIEANNINLEVEEVDAIEVLKGVERSLSSHAQKKDIQIKFQFETENSFVLADKSYLTQVLENLLSNAVKFSEPSKEVLLKSEDLEDSVKLSVIDQGPGVSEADLKNLFKKYQKLSARPTGGEQSTGLGLSIVKKYMEAMGGKVWCESRLGEGACFSIEIKKATVAAAS